MKKFILKQLSKINNRLKGRVDHKNRIKYTKHDVFTSMLYEDFNERVIAVKLPHIAKVYSLDLTNRNDFITACMIAESDITNSFLT